MTWRTSCDVVDERDKAWQLEMFLMISGKQFHRTQITHFPSINVPALFLRNVSLPDFLFQHFMPLQSYYSNPQPAQNLLMTSCSAPTLTKSDEMSVGVTPVTGLELTPTIPSNVVIQEVKSPSSVRVTPKDDNDEVDEIDIKEITNSNILNQLDWTQFVQLAKGLMSSSEVKKAIEEHSSHIDDSTHDPDKKECETHMSVHEYLSRTFPKHYSTNR